MKREYDFSKGVRGKFYNPEKEMADEVFVVSEEDYRSVVRAEHWNDFIAPLRGMADPHSSWQAESKLRAKQDEVLWRLAMANPDDYSIDENDEIKRK